jgi:hypothetical protein
MAFEHERFTLHETVFFCVRIRKNPEWKNRIFPLVILNDKMYLFVFKVYTVLQAMYTVLLAIYLCS